ncbi:MAG: helix-turn-helix transcriptional regulator [Bacteroidetes bacterium]|nr:helix-turn-helix transcriptional regulator [Bacteroidota bacterium]
MATKSKMKLYTMDQVKDEFIGKRGSDKREKYEQELQLELLGDIIKQVRLERNLTQEQLGKLIGVQKAQISKLENNTTNVTMETILRVFTALKAKISFHVELKIKESISPRKATTENRADDPTRNGQGALLSGLLRIPKHPPAGGGTRQTLQCD